MSFTCHAQPDNATRQNTSRPEDRTASHIGAPHICINRLWITCQKSLEERQSVAGLQGDANRLQKISCKVSAGANSAISHMYTYLYYSTYTVITMHRWSKQVNWGLRARQPRAKVSVFAKIARFYVSNETLNWFKLCMLLWTVLAAAADLLGLFYGQRGTATDTCHGLCMQSLPCGKHSSLIFIIFDSLKAFAIISKQTSPFCSLERPYFACMFA